MMKERVLKKGEELFLDDDIINLDLNEKKISIKRNYKRFVL